jgi:alkanesulfonate monooxygenase SsuD/methylene tetrahydromethanopterin reductase-like flavin-dependent oxidoreductase (luciferase family)
MVRRFRRAANRGVPLTASPRHSTAELKDHFARYAEACKRVGYTAEERPIIRETLVLDTLEEAEHFGERGTNGLFGIYGRKSAEGERPLRTDEGELVTNTAMVDFKSMSSRFIIGDPELAKERIVEIKKELEPTELVLRMQMPGVPTELFERSLRLFATKIMPHFS